MCARAVCLNRLHWRADRVCGIMLPGTFMTHTWREKHARWPNECIAELWVGQWSVFVCVGVRWSPGFTALTIRITINYASARAKSHFRGIYSRLMSERHARANIICSYGPAGRRGQSNSHTASFWSSRPVVEGRWRGGNHVGTSCVLFPVERLKCTLIRPRSVLMSLNR